MEPGPGPEAYVDLQDVDYNIVFQSLRASCPLQNPAVRYAVSLQWLCRFLPRPSFSLLTL